jgi:predicted ATPase with chaperone activity
MGFNDPLACPADDAGRRAEPVRHCAQLRRRLSGPLLGRADIRVERAPRPSSEFFVDCVDNERRGEPSAAIRARVEAARARQTTRFAVVKGGGGETPPLPLTCNADMGPTQVRDHCQVDDTAHQLLGTAMRQMNLSARAYHRILKLARTIADLAGSERIQPAHIAKPIHDRPRSSIGRGEWSRTRQHGRVVDRSLRIGENGCVRVAVTKWLPDKVCEMSEVAQAHEALLRHRIGKFVINIL